MKASLLDLRRRMGDILKAIQRNESVTLLRRGKAIAVIRPGAGQPSAMRVADHEAFGMWKTHSDFLDVEAAMAKLRKGRFNGV